MSSDLQRKTPLSVLSMGDSDGSRGTRCSDMQSAICSRRTSSWRKFASVFNFLLVVPPLAFLTTWIYLQVSPDSSRIVEVLSDMLIFLEQ